MAPTVEAMAGSKGKQSEDKTMEELKATIRQNWRNWQELAELIGTPCPESFSFNWGSVPTERAVVTAENEKVSRIRTYSGLSWTARRGYADPVVDTVLKPGMKEKVSSLALSDLSPAEFERQLTELL